MAVDGKVSEPFGPTVQAWSATASPGTEKRLSFLCHQLGLEPPVTAALSYQLLHRAASAIMEAQRCCASQAVMRVHCFS